MRYLAGLLALVSFSAYAQPMCPIATTTPTAARDEARLTWVAPTTNTDGSAIGSPITYRVYRSSGAGSTSFAVQCQTSQVSASLLAQPVGVQNYRVTATVATIESAPSNVASKTIAAPTPNPPASLTVQGDTTAWTIVQSRDRVALVAVGTVAPGAVCDAAQPVLDKWVVPRAAVTFAGSVRPEVVLASCS